MKKRKYASGSLLGTSTANSFGFNRTPAEKAVYGDPTQDPLQRVVGDITGNNIKNAINDMYGNLNTNVAPIDNNTLMDRLYNTPRYQKMDRVYNGDIIAGLGLVGSGTLPVAAGFRYGKGAKNGVLSIDWDNMMAAGQGAMNGSSYGPYGIAAGAILGGLSNYVSQLGINKRVDKWNNAVDTYNLAQNSITDQLINNSRLSQINQYNSNYAKLGGPLNTHGGDFQNGVVEIANGGTHEENPYEGVPMGMDQKGVPNLVEEGEYIWNDYVFSKRIDVPEDMRKKYKFGGKLSFADAVDKVQRESEERPNDPISKRGLNAILTELAMSQEIERQKQQQQEAYEEAENVASIFADGGSIHINKNKRGTFTAAASKHNMGVQEFASHVLANKDKYSSTMVKKANFARNASKWHHALGGKLNKFPEGGEMNDEYDVFAPIPDLDEIIKKAYFDSKRWPSYTSKQVGWQYTTPENRAYAQNWNGNLYSLPFYSTDSVDKLVTNPYNEETWYVPETYENPPVVLSKKPSLPIMGKEIVVTNPEAAKIKTAEDYKPIVEKTKTKDKKQEYAPYNENLRYAPIAGAIGALLNDLRPLDYSNAERIENAARNINRFRGYKPLSNYLAYNPENPAQYANELRSGYAAQLRALNDLSNGNPAQREAVAAAMQRQYGDTIGNMLMKVADYNAKNRMAVEQANNAINQYNSKMAADMAQINQRGEQMYLSGITQGASMRNALEAAQSAAVSSDYNSLFDSLGLVGKENASRNMINEMGMPFFYQDEDGKTHIVYRNTAKCGGKLFKVKK